MRDEEGSARDEDPGALDESWPTLDDEEPDEDDDVEDDDDDEDAVLAPGCVQPAARTNARTKVVERMRANWSHAVVTRH